MNDTKTTPHTVLTNLIHILAPQGTQIRLKRKADSFMMRAIGTLLFFNRSFMTQYVTTIGTTIYTPTIWDAWPTATRAAIIAHEIQHIRDNRRLTSLVYIPMYLAPQILVIPFLIAAGIGAALSVPVLWTVSLALGIICAGPLPAPGRARLEKRAYKISMVATRAFKASLPPNKIAAAIDANAIYYAQQFTTSAYYFMWPFNPGKLKEELKAARPTDSPYSALVYQTLLNQITERPVQ